MRRTALLLAPLVAAGALLAAELGSGAPSYGETHVHDPCKPRTTPEGREGQRFVLSGLDAAACVGGTSREQLVLDLANSRAARVTERALEQALSQGGILDRLGRALDRLRRGG